MQTVAILGATGSVGESTIKVMPELAETHRVTALVAHSRWESIVSQALALRPDFVGLVDDAAAEHARSRLAGEAIAVLSGADVARQVLVESRPDVVMAAITGAAGLPSTLEAVRQGATLALANKEAMVMAGHLIQRAAATSGSAIVPVDSEHSAIFQSLHGEPPDRVRRLFLTASGGPFADLDKASFRDVTPEAAMNHPTWDMGPKITVDSATMMNKALEIIEARGLFAVPSEQISVLVHRQSIVHSMVEFIDGSIIAQLGVPSMTVPVRYALGYPGRARTEKSYFDIESFSRLTFEAPDHDRFPALDLGFQVARELGLSGSVLNAANEVAVERFLDGRLSFDRIPDAVDAVLQQLDNEAEPDLQRILAADDWARAETDRWISSS